MELSEFVAETLRQVMEGVKTAQRQAGELGGRVAPNMLMATTEAERFREREGGAPLHEVEFDVAVTAAEGSTKKAGGSLRVWAIGIGGEGKSSTSTSSASRIRFVVPIKFPPG